MAVKKGARRLLAHRVDMTVYTVENGPPNEMEIERGFLTRREAQAFIDRRKRRDEYTYQYARVGILPVEHHPVPRARRRRRR